MTNSISIAMATYNGEKYISEQIDSLLKQTFSFSELIICDDCSKDNTRQILKTYADKDSRIKVYFNETNLGFKKNFEKAVSLCTSQYIALSDQDDIWVPEHLELLIKAYESNDCVLACGNAFVADAKGNPVGYKCKPDTYYVSQNPDTQFLQVLYSIPVQGCTAFFKKDDFKEYLPIPETQKFHDQWLALLAITKGKIFFVNDGLLYYRTHSNNVTGGGQIGFKAKLNHLFHEKNDAFLKNQIIFNNDIRKFDLTQNQIKTLDKSMQYLRRITRKFARFSAIPYFLKNYKLIYTTTSYKYLLPRFFVKFICHM